jgi:hypothetical protein
MSECCEIKEKKYKCYDDCLLFLVASVNNNHAAISLARDIACLMKPMCRATAWKSNILYTSFGRRVL